MITELAHQLGLTTVSEGVETREQFEALQGLGADHVQGFLIARPMPSAGLESWAMDRHDCPDGDVVAALLERGEPVGSSSA